MGMSLLGYILLGVVVTTVGNVFALCLCHAAKRGDEILARGDDDAGE
jgi:hypothetical protein